LQHNEQLGLLDVLVISKSGDICIDDIWYKNLGRGRSYRTVSTITITITIRYLYSAPYRIGQRRWTV